MELFKVYIYDPNKVVFPGIDTNDLYIGEKFVGEITSCRTVSRFSEIPEDELPFIILIVPCENNLDIRNINPCPDEYI